jgi:hypothetical protein
MITVVPALPALTRMYPDIAVDLMKNISYRVSYDDIVRSSHAGKSFRGSEKKNGSFTLLPFSRSLRIL